MTCSMNRRKALAVVAAALGSPTIPSWSQTAQRFPARPIKIVQGGIAGGQTDVMARIIGEHLFKSSEQPFFVESKPGANQAIAIKEVARAAPDGHTLLVATTGFTLNLLRDPPPYGANDVVPVAQLASLPTILAVSSTLGVETLDQLLALLRRNPGKFSYGTPGVASAPHINGELLSRSQGLKLVHVPYKGEAAIVTDLVSGDVAATWATLATLTPLAQAGKVKLLAVTGDKRVPAVPEVPTSVELGHPMLTGYTGMFTAGGTPAALVRQLSDEVTRIVKIPSVAQSIGTRLGAVPVGAGSDAFASHLQAEFKRWKEAAALTGIQFT